MGAEDKLEIKLNQNLWVLIVSLLGLGVSEYFNLNILLYFGLVLSICSTLSIILTLGFYTYNYCKNKKYEK